MSEMIQPQIDTHKEPENMSWLADVVLKSVALQDHEVEYKGNVPVREGDEYVRHFLPSDILHSASKGVLKRISEDGNQSDTDVYQALSYVRYSSEVMREFTAYCGIEIPEFTADISEDDEYSIEIKSKAVPGVALDVYVENIRNRVLAGEDIAEVDQLEVLMEDLCAKLEGGLNRAEAEGLAFPGDIYDLKDYVVTEIMQKDGSKSLGLTMVDIGPTVDTLDDEDGELYFDQILELHLPKLRGSVIEAVNSAQNRRNEQ